MMHPLQVAIGDAILGRLLGASRDTTRVTLERSYSQAGYPARDTWTGTVDGLAEHIAVALEKTTLPGAEVTAVAGNARTTVLTALARALREQPTGARILDGLDELGEALVCGSDPDEVRSWVDGVSLLAGIGLAPAVADEGLTFYQASHDSITVGRYTTDAVARRHCESLLSNEYPSETVLLYDWIGDESEPEDPWELAVQINGGDQQPTGYTVQPLRIEADFDPDAEW